jgi:hypothetical protein
MENKKEIAFLFYYSYQSTCYALSCLPPWLIGARR